MNKFTLSFFALLLLVSCSSPKLTIVVSNSLGIDRKSEMVEVKTNTLTADFQTKSYILKNDKNEEVAYQLIYDENKKPETLIFQVNVDANKEVTYTLSEGKPAEVKPKTFARFVPERKDDFAWENDLAAYRMYGPALANENPSNGVDLWLKCTNDLIVDKFYGDEQNHEISYHVDHGLGLDCYKVAHTLGCGGIAPYASDSLWIGNHYDSYKVLENGPLQSVFQLTYDSVKVGDNYYKQEITITTNAGSMLNKGVVKYTGPDQNMELATGIYLHDKIDNLKQNVENGTSGYAENAVSDAGVPAGRNYIGVFIPEKVNNVRTIDDHALMLSSYKVGDTFTYYFGGGWNKWGYPTDDDWFKALDHFSEITKNPLKITIK
jgi:uncharacterized protein YcfL